MPRNPNWPQDVLILTRDLYFTLNLICYILKENLEALKLIETIYFLSIHSKAKHGDKFSDPNGVFLKLVKFQSFYLNYAGTKFFQSIETCRFWPKKSMLSMVRFSYDTLNVFVLPYEIVYWPG